MNKNFWSGKKILLTGGSGFLGSNLYDFLRSNSIDILAPTKIELNLLDRKSIKKYLQYYNPNILIHTAVFSKDIADQNNMSAEILHNNLLMDINIMHEAFVAKVDKFVGFGSYWAYPGNINDKLIESKYLDGEVSIFVKSYAMTKRMLATMSWAYKEQYGFNSINLILPNIYGNNQKKHNVFASFLYKFKKASLNNEKEIVLWGDGSPVRDFFFIKDAVSSIIKAIEVYDDSEPLNLGTGVGVSIKELAYAIKEKYQFMGKIIWDINMPNGIPYRVMDVDKMKKVLGLEFSIDFKKGINIMFEYDK